MEDKELNQVEENESEEQEYYTKDEVLDIIEEITPKIKINVDDLDCFKLNEDEFENGLRDISYVCGQFIGLISVGVANVDAFQYT